MLGKVTGLHRYFKVSDSTLPPNKSGYALVDGMAKAWELYGNKKYDKRNAFVPILLLY